MRTRSAQDPERRGGQEDEMAGRDHDDADRAVFVHRRIVRYTSASLQRGVWADRAGGELR
jgi:hypothetical protein